MLRVLISIRCYIASISCHVISYNAILYSSLLQQLFNDVIERQRDPQHLTPQHPRPIERSLNHFLHRSEFERFSDPASVFVELIRIKDPNNYVIL